MEEIFKDIPGYEGIYQVSNLGRVKSLPREIWKNGFYITKEKILKPNIGNIKYCYVILYKNLQKKTIRVHQLVAMAFLNHTPCGHKLVVNHKDFNRLNNNVENLEIITSRENTNKKHLKSSSKYIGVNWCKTNLKWKSRIVFNGKRISLGYFKTEIEAHNAYQNKLKEIETL